MGQVGTRLHRVRRRRRPRRPARRRDGLAPNSTRRRRGHHPQRLPGLRRRCDVRPEARVDRHPGVVELRGVRVGFPGPAVRPRADPGRDVRRRIGDRCRHHPEGVLRPGRRGTPRRSGLAALPPDRCHQHRLLRSAGPAPDGPLRRDDGGLRAREGEELPAWPGQPECALPQGILGRGRRGQPGGLRSASAARHLRHLRWCGRADRGEQVIRREAPRVAGRCAVGACGVLRHPELPAVHAGASRYRHRLDGRGGRTGSSVQGPHPRHRLRRGRHGPRGPQPGRGLRPVHRTGTRLVRAPRVVRQG